MIICIANVLSAEDAKKIRDRLTKAAFRDGQVTAGWHAREVKRNTQADPLDDQIIALRKEVHEALANNTLFTLAARPTRIMPVLFSRYLAGMEYGLHVDDAMMNSPEGTLRTDIAMTLFLSDEDEYDGGELVIDTTAGEQSYKLPAGSIILYPASSLHRVEPVIRGERLAAVGWIQSQVRDPVKREILFDLDNARRQIFDQQGKTTAFDAVSKSLANLIRMWGEP